jgi:hypothetical protein
VTSPLRRRPLLGPDFIPEPVAMHICDDSAEAHKNPDVSFADPPLETADAVARRGGERARSGLTGYEGLNTSRESGHHS